MCWKVVFVFTNPSRNKLTEYRAVQGGGVLYVAVLQI